MGERRLDTGDQDFEAGFRRAFGDRHFAAVRGLIAAQHRRKTLRHGVGQQHRDEQQTRDHHGDHRHADQSRTANEDVEHESGEADQARARAGAEHVGH